MTLNSPQDLRLFSTMRNEVTLQSDSRAYFDGNVVSLGGFVNCGYNSFSIKISVVKTGTNTQNNNKQQQRKQQRFQLAARALTV